MINEEGIALICEFEGFREVAYQDLVGVWTIGFGFTDGVKPGDRITRAEGEARLAREVESYAAAVLAGCTTEPTENELAAMTSLAFNIGKAGFARSSVLRAHNRGDRPAAARAFGLWNKAGGKVVAGLTRRRAAEAALYLKPAMVTNVATPAAQGDERPSTGPIVTGTTVTAGAGMLATLAEASESVGKVRDALGDLFLPLVLGAILVAAGWVIYSRYRQRSQGWA